jgi:hypothetical protein
MKTKSWQVGVLVAASLLPALRAEARESGPFTLTLQSPPQEAAGDAAAAAAFAGHPAKVMVVEGRAGADLTAIGEISDHADKVFPIHAANDAVAWADGAFKQSAASAGIRVSPDAPLALTAKLTGLKLTAVTKAFGSTYNAEIQLTYILTDGKGRTLWQGAAEGSANRYGKARSAENANEVLADAVKEAFGNVLNDAGLQGAWGGRQGTQKPVAVASPSAAAPAATAAMSPADLLADLVKLKKQGFTSDLLVDYVNKKTLSHALSADDLVKWKNAGMPEEVIKSAMSRAEG